MPTSPYFNNQAATREQFLLEDLVIESIRNHGIDIFYLPRDSRSQLDTLFGDDPVKSYTSAFAIDMYLDTFNNFEGNQEFFSKFGLEIQKTAQITVARRTFEKLMPTDIRALPKEGDLIWLPVQEKLMEIRFVEEEKNFFQLGKIAPYMFKLSIESFKYNGELIKTGIISIDNVADASAFGILYNLIAGGSGSYIAHEVVYQGNTLGTATALAYVSVFDKPGLTLKLRNIKGQFNATNPIIGVDSGAAYLINANYDDMDDVADNFRDNVLLQTEADNFIDFTESNPFGEP
jgi:hypothetical protein